MSTTALERYEAGVVGPPNPAEWATIIEVAKTVAPTQFVPAGLRNNVPAVCAAILTGRELEIGPMQALKHVAIIDGKATLSAELMVALIRRHAHSIQVVEHSADLCTVHGKRRDSGDEVTVTWGIQQAERAGLLTKNNWQNYPEAMLWARAVSQLARELFPDLIAGFGYTAEELGDDGTDRSQVVYEDVVPEQVEGDVAQNAPQDEVIDVEPVTVRDEAEVEEGLEALALMHDAASAPEDGGEPQDGDEAQEAALQAAAPPPATVSDAIQRAEAAAGRSVTSGEQTSEPQAEPELPPTGDEFDAEVVAAQVKNNIDLLARLNVDQLRKLAGHMDLPQRGRRKEELVIALVDAFHIRGPEATPGPMEGEDAAFEPSAATAVTSDDAPAVVTVGAWEDMGQEQKAAVLDAALDVIAQHFPDDVWRHESVLFTVNKTWNLGADSLREIPTEFLDKVWEAVPQQAKEILGV